MITPRLLGSYLDYVLGDSLDLLRLQVVAQGPFFHRPGDGEQLEAVVVKRDNTAFHGRGLSLCVESCRLWRDSLVVEHLDLFFKDLDINPPRLPLDKNAVNARPLRAERSAILCDLRAMVAGITNPDDRAGLQRFNQVLGRHFWILRHELHQGAIPMIRRSSARMIPSSDPDLRAFRVKIPAEALEVGAEVQYEAPEVSSRNVGFGGTRAKMAAQCVSTSFKRGMRSFCQWVKAAEGTQLPRERATLAERYCGNPTAAWLRPETLSVRSPALAPKSDTLNYYPAVMAPTTNCPARMTPSPSA
jgi:hypothetical protein